MKFFGYELDPILFNIILPLGISFYTFQTISCTVDVYRGVIRPRSLFLIMQLMLPFFLN